MIIMEDKFLKLKREAEVAIAILVACARSNNRRLKTADAAKVAATTSDFAAHIVLKLVNAGFLKTKRGRNGGLELSRPANAISLRDIICRVKDQQSDTSEGRRSSGEKLKVGSLKQIMLGANHAVQTYLDRFSIADLADNERATGDSQIGERSSVKRVRRPTRRAPELETSFPR